MTEFTDQQKRWLEGFHQRPCRAQGGDTGGCRRTGRDAADRSGRAAIRRAGPHDCRGRQAGRGGEGQAAAPSARSLGRGRRAFGEGRVSQGHRRLPDQVPRTFLRRAGRELLHVPAAHPQRHPECLADARPGRCRRLLWRRLCRRDDARQPAGPRDPGEPRGRPAAGACRRSASPRAARAPTISATSPAARPPASIRRS